MLSRSVLLQSQIYLPGVNRPRSPPAMEEEVSIPVASIERRDNQLKVPAVVANVIKRLIRERAPSPPPRREVVRRRGFAGGEDTAAAEDTQDTQDTEDAEDTASGDDQDGDVGGYCNRNVDAYHDRVTGRYGRAVGGSEEDSSDEEGGDVEGVAESEDEPDGEVAALSDYADFTIASSSVSTSPTPSIDEDRGPVPGRLNNLRTSPGDHLPTPTTASAPTTISRRFTPYVLAEGYSGVTSDGAGSSDNQTLVVLEGGHLRVKCDVLLLPTRTPVPVRIYPTGTLPLPIVEQRCTVDVFDRTGYRKLPAVARHDSHHHVYLEVQEFESEYRTAENTRFHLDTIFAVAT